MGWTAPGALVTSVTATLATNDSYDLPASERSNYGLWELDGEGNVTQQRLVYDLSLYEPPPQENLLARLLANRVALAALAIVAMVGAGYYLDRRRR